MFVRTAARVCVAPTFDRPETIVVVAVDDDLDRSICRPGARARRRWSMKRLCPPRLIICFRRKKINRARTHAHARTSPSMMVTAAPEHRNYSGLP
jgi:hypothetical protein